MISTFSKTFQNSRVANALRCHPSGSPCVQANN